MNVRVNLASVRLLRPSSLRSRDTTIEDAIDALTDPDCLVMDGRSRRCTARGVVGISCSKVVIRLQSLEPLADQRTPDERVAWALDFAREAAAEIGAREIVEPEPARPQLTARQTVEQL